MRAITRFLTFISDKLNNFAMWAAIISVGVMLASAGWQVVARYVLDQPPIWTEELARYAMVWGGLLGASCAFHSKSDPTLFPEMRDHTGRGHQLLSAIRGIGTLLFIAPILWFSIFGLGVDPSRGFVARLAGRMADTMPVPMVIFGIAVPVAMIIIVIHTFASLSAILSVKPHSEVEVARGVA